MEIIFEAVDYDGENVFSTKVSPVFLGQLMRLGFSDFRKLGEGIENLILEARNVNGTTYALVINKRFDINEQYDEERRNEINNLKSIQESDPIINNYMVKIYDLLCVHGKLSDDYRFMNKNIMIIVEEKADITLSMKARFLRSIYTISQKQQFLESVKKRLILIKDYFETKNIFHYDSKPDNIMFMDAFDVDSLVLIDITSFMEINKEQKRDDRDIDDTLATIIQYTNNESSISRSIEESQKLGKLLNLNFIFY